MDLIKIVNLPIIAKEFKIVQLYHNSQPIMLCGTMELKKKYFHWNILEDYLKANNIEFEAFAPDIRFPMSVIPRPEKTGVYKVVGAGYAGIAQDIEHFQLPYGSSRDYKMQPSEEFKDKLREMFRDGSPYWEELKAEKTRQ
jgi:hypothetical protein